MMNYEGYDIALICINGHVINASAGTEKQYNTKFCDECGARTISQCEKCGTNIKGTYHYPGVYVAGLGYNAPKFCDSCGNPYPWTEGKINAVSELTMLSDKLNDDEKADLKNNIEDLIRNTQNVPVAIPKVKGYLAKAGQEFAKGLRDILVDILSSTVKKAIWGTP